MSTTATDDEAGTDDDGTPVLSAATLGLLQSFYADRDAEVAKFADLKSKSKSKSNPGGGVVVNTTNTTTKSALASTMEYPLSMSLFAEDWNASQFWYDEGTARRLAADLINVRGFEKGGECAHDKGVEPTVKVAVLSCPSVFVAARNLLHEMDVSGPEMVLLEFDDRFDVFGDGIFVRWDFETGVRQIPIHLKGRFDRVLIDPPYHSEDCLRKFATTVKWLLNPRSVHAGIVVCTGESLEDAIEENFGDDGVRPTEFEILHERGRLKSEYICYASFESEALKWK